MRDLAAEWQAKARRDFAAEDVDANHNEPLDREINGQRITTEEESAFAETFKEYQYGREETDNARHWFVSGYRAAKKIEASK